MMEVKQILREKLESHLLEDSDDLLFYIQDASRLAALGDEDYFKRLPEIFSMPLFKGKIVEILEERCREGIWDIEERLGEPLGLALIDAQDFFCFWRRMKEILPPKMEPLFEAWWEECADAQLDAEAAEILDDFRMTYPISEEDLLPVVETPITETEKSILRELFAHVEIPVLELAWKPKNAVKETLAELVCFDDGRPSDAMKRRVESLENRIKTPHGTWVISRQLNDDWSLGVTIEDENGKSPAINWIRLGTLAAKRDEEDPVYWTFSLKRLAHETRNQLLESKPLFIYATGGFTIQITPNKNETST